ncbi:MAG: substrate-binding domain-containing protein [Planctomycetota bacterium]
MTTRSAQPAHVLAAEYPSRGAAEVLGQRVAELLRGGAYGVGDRFLTDDELVEATGLSRSTVRRALSDLTRAGWLDRRAGRGTYVGRTEGPALPAATPPLGMNQTIRVGVLAFSGHNPAYDWLTPPVLRGMNEVASVHGVRVELTPGFTGKLSEAAERLDADRPDVLISLSDRPRDAMLLRLASERGVRCMVMGTPFSELDLPRVCEDNRGGMALAVKRLAELGHERIGLVMRRWPGGWLFKRHEQWHASLEELGLDHDESLMHWLPLGDAEFNSTASVNALQQWIERVRPSVVLGGHYSPAQHLGELVRAGRLRVPEDVSVALIDQHPEAEFMLGMRPACVELPLQEMGRRAAELSVAWCSGQAPPSLTKLPMKWSPGPSLAPSS